MELKVLFGFFGIILLIGAVYYLHQRTYYFTLNRWYFQFLFIKFIAGITVGIVYFYHYKSGDTTAYHQDALSASNLAFSNVHEYINFLFTQNDNNILPKLNYSNEPRALLVSKILSVIYIFSFQNYWVSGLFFSLFSFSGIWYLSNYIINKYPISRPSVAISFFLFPSVVFWSSGVLKESILMGSLGLLICFALQIIEDKNTKPIKILALVIAIIILWSLKYYYAAVLLPILLALGVLKLITNNTLMENKKILVSFLFLLIIASMLYIASFLHVNLHFERVLIVLVENYQTIKSISKPENIANFENLAPTFSSLLFNFPKAVITGLYRPFIWETTSFLSVLISIENLFLLVLSLISILHIKNFFKTTNYPLLIGVLVFVFIMAALLAISTPNFGTLSRYRIGYLPFFLLLIINNLFVQILKGRKKTII